MVCSRSLNSGFKPDIRHLLGADQNMKTIIKKYLVPNFLRLSDKAKLQGAAPIEREEVEAVAGTVSQVIIPRPSGAER